MPRPAKIDPLCDVLNLSGDGARPATYADHVKGRNIFKRVLFSSHEEQTHSLHGDLRLPSRRSPHHLNIALMSPTRQGAGLSGTSACWSGSGSMTDIPPHLIELARRLQEALRAAALRREKRMADVAHRRPS